MQAPLCIRCGRPGPFYPSQARSWCCACLKAYGKARYARVRPAVRRRARLQALAALQAIPDETRTRRETKRLLDSQAPPDQKVCTWCWQTKPRTPNLWTRGSTPDGLDYYCRACRRILDRLRTTNHA